ncbi:hypothetical protein POM88_039010 [Heracleum sosnowskyi]|uniref:Uncharacterized protein n=1 Tax=Heracleum sosnowskyi TaxID=360622 RepID=A0AAD8HBT0_9APIA|nr:hypothetical protein POM88_039010 [Heracleum sosnowskyi]
MTRRCQNFNQRCSFQATSLFAAPPKIFQRVIAAENGPKILQDHEKEMIKKTMLQHEFTFKHQVNELHRLYRRQKELIDEAKMRSLSANNVKGKTVISNSIRFGGLSASSDRTYHNPNFTLVDPSCQWPSSTFNFQVASNFDAGKSMQADTNTSITASSLKATALLPSSSKELSKRTFDLELPADEYIDREVKRFREGFVSGVSKAPDYAIKDLSAVCPLKEFNLSICKDQLNPSEGNSSGTNLIPSITNLADLNEMFQLKKEGTLYSTSLLPLNTSNMEKPHLEQSCSQKPKTVYQIQTKEIDCFQIGKDLENRSEDLYLEKVSRQHEHASSNHLTSATKPIETPASLSKNATLSVENYCLNNNVYLSRNLRYDPRSASVCSLQNNLLHRLPAEDVNSSSVLASQLSNLTNSLEMVTTHGNEQLDSTIQGLNWLQGKLVPGGISDKVKESFSQGLGLRPPKDFLMSSSYVEPKWHGTKDILNYGSNRSSYDSKLTKDQLFKSHPNLSEVKVTDNYEEIGIPDPRLAYPLTVSKMNWSAQSEMLNNGVHHKFQIDLNSSLNEDGSAQVEVETKSATDVNLKPLVSPENKESSPPRGNSKEMQPTDLALSAAEALLLIASNNAESLKWFAGVVSSAANIQEENETVQGHLTNRSELVADGLNSAALTQQIKDKKFEENCSNSTRNKKRKAPVTSSSLPKRKRTRRIKTQKVMQGDILPRITSPSRQEVALENHTISELRENEGKARSGKKKLSKNERQKGKKHNSKSNLLQHPMCSSPKQQTDDAKPDSPERCLPAWGRRNRRQTGQRRPAPIRARSF